MEHSGKLHSPPPRHCHHHPKAVLRARASIHKHQSPPPPPLEQKTLKNVKCQSLDNERKKEEKEENENNNNFDNNDEDISKFKEFVSKISKGHKKQQQQRLSNESIRKLSTTSLKHLSKQPTNQTSEETLIKQPTRKTSKETLKQPERETFKETLKDKQKNPNIANFSPKLITNNKTFASSSNINNFSQLPPPIRFRCRPPLLAKKQQYQWKENNFIHNSNQNSSLLENNALKQYQSSIPRSPQLLMRHGSSKVGPIEKVSEELKQNNKNEKVKHEDLKTDKENKIKQGRLRKMELKQDKDLKQNLKQVKEVKQNVNQEKELKQTKEDLDLNQNDEHNELKQHMKQEMEMRQNIKQENSLKQNMKQENNLLQETEMEQKAKQTKDEDNQVSSKKQKKRLLIKANNDSLQRSSSQSRCLSTTSNNQKSENFLKFMSRSKTSTNLAVNSSREASASLSWLRSIRGKSPSHLKTRQNNNNNNNYFTSKTLKTSNIFDAVVDVFNPLENQKFFEASWDLQNNFYQKLVGEENQYTRVQRELKCLAERRALTVGSKHTIRVADFSSIEHMFLMMNKKSSEKRQINENEMFQKPRQRALQDYYNDDDAELEG